MYFWGTVRGEKEAEGEKGGEQKGEERGLNSAYKLECAKNGLF